MYGFQYVTGHEGPAARLRQAVGGEGPAHAYVLSGEKGMGKKTLAKAFAKTLQCEAPRGGDACGVCLSCRVFESGNHPDVVYVTGTNAQSIGVEDVREQVVRPMSLKPFRYRYKIFVIDEAETLTPAAQNALLKTVEEPAPYGVFIFLAAQTRALLPTVLSRCVVHPLKPLPDGHVIQALAAAGVPEETARSCAAFARGNIGRALDLSASEEFPAMRALAADIISQTRRGGPIEVFALYRRCEKYKDAFPFLLDMLYGHCRDKIVEHTGEIPLKALFQAVDAIARARRALRRNGNFQLCAELLLLDIVVSRGTGRN